MSWSLAPVIMSDYVGRRKMLHMKLRLLMGFLRWCSGKEPSFQSRSCKRPRFGPWVRKILWRRKWQPAAVFLPGKSHGQRSLVGYSPGGRKELDAAESLSTYTCTHSREIVVNHLGWPSVINKGSHQRTRRQKIESEGGDVGVDFLLLTWKMEEWDLEPSNVVGLPKFEKARDHLTLEFPENSVLLTPLF